MARIVARSGERALPLEGWSWLATMADAVATPADLPENGDWREAAVPGTVAGTLHSSAGSTTPAPMRSASRITGIARD